MSERPFERVVVIIFENEFRGNVMRNPYMRSLAAKGIELADSFGVMHPSNPNYVASIAGEICNISSDPVYTTFLPAPPIPPPPQPLPQKTLVDLMADQGVEWRAYMEGYSTVAFPPQLDPVTSPSGGTDIPATVNRTILDYPPYLNMHNAFIRFQSITGNEKQWKRIGTSYDFLRDMLDGTLPEYSWFTPDIWSCGHWLWGTYEEPAQRAPFLVDQLAKWLESFFGVLAFPGPQSRVPRGTLVVVTFDESDYNESYEQVRGWDGTYDGPNQIYTVLLGDGVAPRRVEGEGYNHYSLLKTIQKNLGLPTLGKNDAEANWLRFLWGESFRWGEPKPTPIESATTVAAASLGDTLYVVYGSGDALSCRTWSGRRWADEQEVPGIANASAVAMAANGSLMVIAESQGALSAVSWNDGTWSEPQSIAAGVTAFSIASFHDYGDQTEKLMLVWSTSEGLVSQTFANGAWQSPLAVGQQSGGAVALAVLGASLFLIFAANGGTMNVVTYNTAPFNVVTSAGDSNTTQYTWSPSAFPVQHFAAGPLRAPGTERSVPPYEGAAPFAVATLDGVIHFAQRGSGETTVLQETTFSLSGVLTPQNPVDYRQSGTGVSNGYGTLAEAGWSRLTPIAGAAVGADSAIAMARRCEDLALLSQKGSGKPLLLSIGTWR